MLNIVLFSLAVAGAQGFFQQMFGDGVQFEMAGGHPFGGVRKTPDANVEVQVALEDFYNGKSLSLSFQRRAACSVCKGTGAKTTKKCPHCNGRGMFRHPVHPFPQACPHCDGQGKIAATKCPECSGQKLIKQTVTKNVLLPAGSPDGFSKRLAGLADEHPGVEAGDVVVNLKMAPHNVFARDNRNLKTTAVISLGEALLGFTRSIPHLSGQAVEVSSSEPSQHLSKITVKGEGMPTGPKRKVFGDLEVTLQVRFPTRLTPGQLTALQEAFPDEYRRIEEALEETERESGSEDDDDDDSEDDE